MQYLALNYTGNSFYTPNSSLTDVQAQAFFAQSQPWNASYFVLHAVEFAVLSVAKLVVRCMMMMAVRCGVVDDDDVISTPSGARPSAHVFLHASFSCHPPPRLHSIRCHHHHRHHHQHCRHMQQHCCSIPHCPSRQPPLVSLARIRVTQHRRHQPLHLSSRLSKPTHVRRYIHTAVLRSVISPSHRRHVCNCRQLLLPPSSILIDPIFTILRV